MEGQDDGESSSSDDLNENIKQTGSFDGDESSDDQLSDFERGRLGRSMELRRLRYQDLTNKESTCLNFAMEHRIFLRAMLGLLNERDKTATEIRDKTATVFKCGPLKKASHLLTGVWKMKYVEIRRGMFSYFEDVVSGEENTPCSLLQKNIPLDSSETSCRAVKIHRNGLNIMIGGIQGAIFELKVGKFGRLWLARSRAERQKWIQEINDAMVGRSINQDSNAHGRSGNVNSRSPYKDDLKLYLKVKSNLKAAKSKKEYIDGLSNLSGREPLNVPVRWIMEQVGKNNGRTEDNTMGAFVQTSITNSVEQLWRDLCRDKIRINNSLFLGDSGYGPEKMIGCLTRDIVAFSRSDSKYYRYAIPEAKAVAYARDILLSINRTRSGGDSYFCIDTLSSNSDLVVIVPSSREAEPLSISVKLDEPDGFADYSTNDKTGWIRTRNSIQKSWRKRFFVLSEGTLSFYQHAIPRPHGFRKQDVITDATISVDEAKDQPGYYVISIDFKDGIQERHLYFNSVDKVISWAHALECVAKSSSNQFGKRVRENSSSQEIRQMIEQAMKTHLTTLNLDSTDIEERLAHLSAKTISRIRISAYATQEYSVCTKDPQGFDEDTWATLTATFLQRFRITCGRIVCGEEIVQVGFSGSSDIIEDGDNFYHNDQED
mmetsp:Transcript_58975/g.66779  ORF Transcript_58975/g.66779 Transcript_58975/m.66779 type:complete len:658 (-) Transcript_58975:1727-3700(-)